jgi:hypothetical protein
VTDLERELLAVLQAIVDSEEMKKANRERQMKDCEAPLQPHGS